MSAGRSRSQAQALFERAFDAHRAGRLDEAQRLYRESIATFPTAEAHTFLGWTFSQQGKIAEAIAECKRAIEIDPDFGNPYNDIGAYLIELGELDDAVGWLHKAKEARRYGPRHFPFLNLGRVYLAKGWLARALDEFTEAARIEPRDPVSRRAIEHIQRKLN